MDAEQPVSASAGAERLVVDDVDAMAAVLADGLQGEFVQLEATRFSARWTVVHGKDTVVQFASEDLAVVRRLRLPRDRWACTIPLALPAAARWNGRTVKTDDIVVSPPGSECYAFDPRGTEFAIITAHLSSRMAVAARQLIGGDATGTIIASCGGLAAALRERLEQLRAKSERSALQGETVDDACDEVARAVAACLAPRLEDGSISSPASRSRIVSRAEQCFRSHGGEGLSIAQLSTLTGVSERSLRNAFHDVYTTSPKRYLKIWQLHQVRHALRAADVDRGETVTDVATGHGFYELGRFAGEYKSLFGEAPSETLNRARHRPGRSRYPSSRTCQRIA